MANTTPCDFSDFIRYKSMEVEKEIKQEIFVKLKLSERTSKDINNFTWRDINSNEMWLRNVTKETDNLHVSFTSEFNLNCFKEQILDFINNGSSFSIGEGKNRITLNVQVVEIKEEAEIYAL